MICTENQIKNIILTNPNKDNIDFGKSQSKILSRNIYGKDLKESFVRNSYFENQQVFDNRVLNPTSNKDLFARLFHREEMVFTAHGGVRYYSGLNENQTKQLNSKLDTIRFGENIRKWIQNTTLKAYRSDPMGVIHIEIDADNNIYPTYKCIDGIYDYLSNGRKLEYICYQLSKSDAISFGIQDKELYGKSNDTLTNYFRFCDDVQDVIYIRKDDTITLAILSKPLKNPIKNKLPNLPAFVVSNIIAYNNTQLFISPIDNIVELAERFCFDRTVRDLTKKYCGFPKTIEPLLNCGTCNGTGNLSGSTCPDCNGTTFKLKTNVGDVARFSLDVLKDGFSIDKIFGYVKTPVETLNKQDTSLNDDENMIVSVYWGTDLRATTTNGPDIGAKNIEETATKTLANLQPIYARLNKTADWAQETENNIINIIGQFMFSEQFKGSLVTYGRYYVLETPDTLINEYLQMKEKGCSQVVLDETLKKYYHSIYKDNQIKLAIMIKMMSVEPFIHHTIVEVYAANASKQDYIAKLYFNEWFLNQKENDLLVQDIPTLQESLLSYTSEKDKLDSAKPAEATPPSASISERVIS